MGNYPFLCLKVKISELSDQMWSGNTQIYLVILKLFGRHVLPFSGICYEFFLIFLCILDL